MINSRIRNYDPEKEEREIYYDAAILTPLTVYNNDEKSRHKRIENAFFQFDLAFGKQSEHVYSEKDKQSRIELWDKYTNRWSDPIFDGKVEQCITKECKTYPTLGDFLQGELPCKLELELKLEFERADKIWRERKIAREESQGIKAAGYYLTEREIEEEGKRRRARQEKASMEQPSHNKTLMERLKDFF